MEIPSEYGPLNVCQHALSLQFTDVSYVLADKKGGSPKEVLHGVSGHFKSGRLTAILGPSGAGKSSLLNVLSGFKTKGVTGLVQVNGVERNPDEFRTQSCYITQDQSMLPQLTLKETLIVAANLKLEPGWEKRSATSTVVSNIFHLLGLTGSKDTSVQYLSGGERKRLSIGLELISNPPIMFFDEPTSGLDSSSSVQVISHLRGLSASGHAVVCVIHQPSSRIFQMFDDLYLVSEGNCLYSGTTQDMVGVFESAGFKCPDYYNRADFAIEVACRERGTDLSSLLELFKASSENTTNTHLELALVNETTQMLPSKSITISVDAPITIKNGKPKFRRYPTSQLQQFGVLFHRAIRCTVRDLHMAQIRFVCHIAVGLLLGMIYYGIGNEASKVDSNTACLFFFLMFLFFSNAMPTVQTFPSEMSVFLREHLNNWYSLPPYYFSKILANVPLQVLCPVTFLVIGYFLTDQPIECSRFWMTLLTCELLTILAQALGLVLGAACDMKLGVFLVPVTTIPMFLFSGFFLRLQDIPFYLRWIANISYFKHAFEATVIAIYGFNRANLVCSQPYCQYKYPEKLLEDMGMSDDSYWCDILGLVMWITGLHIILYIVLKWRVYTSR